MSWDDAVNDDFSRLVREHISEIVSYYRTVRASKLAMHVIYLPPSQTPKTHEIDRRIGPFQDPRYLFHITNRSCRTHMFQNLWTHGLTTHISLSLLVG